MVTYILTWLSACINPIIYCLTNKAGHDDNDHYDEHVDDYPYLLRVNYCCSIIAKPMLSWCES